MANGNYHLTHANVTAQVSGHSCGPLSGSVIVVEFTLLGFLKSASAGQLMSGWRGRGSVAGIDPNSWCICSSDGWTLTCLCTRTLGPCDSKDGGNISGLKVWWNKKLFLQLLKVTVQINVRSSGLDGSSSVVVQLDCVMEKLLTLAGSAGCFNHVGFLAASSRCTFV